MFADFEVYVNTSLASLERILKADRHPKWSYMRRTNNTVYNLLLRQTNYAEKYTHYNIRVNIENHWLFLVTCLLNCTVYGQAAVNTCSVDTFCTRRG